MALTLMERLEHLVRVGGTAPGASFAAKDVAEVAREALAEINRCTTARILMSTFDAPVYPLKPRTPDTSSAEAVNFDRMWSKSMAGF